MAESNLAYIIAAYALTWVVALAYMWYLGRLERDEMDRFEVAEEDADAGYPHGTAESSSLHTASNPSGESAPDPAGNEEREATT